MPKLNARQQLFVEEYLIDLNATQAALRAHYSRKTAAFIGAENLRKPQIQSAISAAMAARSERIHITQDDVLRELKILDFSDITDFDIDDRGNVALMPAAPKLAMRAVSSLRKKITHTDQGITYETEIKLWNKPAALKMSGQHLGMFIERHEHTGKDGKAMPPLQIILSKEG